jgi:iron(III) transport system substrate-binding protein
MMNGRRWLKIAAIAVAVELAIGGEGLAADVVKGPAKSPPALDTSFDAKWKALAAKAKEEGELVIIMGASDSRHHRAMFDHFGKRFGIKVVASTGSGTSNTNRLLAERSRGRYTGDISLVGQGSTDRLREAGALVPLPPLLFHPEVVDRSKGWWLTDVYWTDRDNKYSLADTLRLDHIFEIWYNSAKLSQAEVDSIQSYWDLLRPEFRGRMAGRALGAAAGTTERTRIWLTLGEKYIARLYTEQKMTLFPADQHDPPAEGLARGKWDLIMCCDRAARPLMKLGLPVKPLTDSRVMKEGMVAEVRGTFSVLDKAPHPNAAQLFTNWFFSRDGQTAKQTLTTELDATPSLRSDVPQGKVSDDEWANVRKVRQLAADGKTTILNLGSPQYFQAQDESAQKLGKILKDLGHGF